MVEGIVVDLTSGLEIECLWFWFCFSGFLQKILYEGNTHGIRGSRHDTVRGRPDSLYCLPELYGATDQFLLSISQAESGYASSHVIESDYQEYFQYVCGLCGLEQPNDWKQALELYNVLL